MPHKPYMPFYTREYMADTAHLSGEEHGYYMLMLITYWETEKPLPNDEQELARICKTTPLRLKKFFARVLRLFQLKNNFLYHKRVEKELVEYYEKLDLKRLAGKKAAEKRWGGNNASGIADAYQTHSRRITDLCHTEAEAEAEAYGSKDFNNCDTAVVVATTTGAPATIAADFQNVKNYFLEQSPAFFPDIPTTLKFWSSPKLQGMLSVWSQEGVTLEDVQAAVEHQRAKDDYKPNPYYYANAAIEFARERKKFGKYQSRGPKSKYERLREEADRNVEIALQQARERGEIE